MGHWYFFYFMTIDLGEDLSGLVAEGQWPEE